MKKLAYISSTANSIICPCCGIDELERSAEGVARCRRCDRSISTRVLKTFEQIVSLPDVFGSHACDCGHPEMRRLADGIMWCPGCGSEVLPISDSEMRSEPESVSEPYRCGWADGLFGSTEPFAHNEGLARREDTNDRLAYYRGHRAGRAVRF